MVGVAAAYGRPVAEVGRGVARVAEAGGSGDDRSRLAVEVGGGGDCEDLVVGGGHGVGQVGVVVAETFAAGAVVTASDVEVGMGPGAGVEHGHGHGPRARIDPVPQGFSVDAVHAGGDGLRPGGRDSGHREVLGDKGHVGVGAQFGQPVVRDSGGVAGEGGTVDEGDVGVVAAGVGGHPAGIAPVSQHHDIAPGARLGRGGSRRQGGASNGANNAVTVTAVCQRRIWAVHNGKGMILAGRDRRAQEMASSSAARHLHHALADNESMPVCAIW